MPRNKRSSPQPETPKQPQTFRGPTWHVEEKYRFWCPLCGMVADLDRLDHSPYPTKIMLQRYGGKLPDGRGYMEYVPVDGGEKSRLIGKLERILRLLPGRIEAEKEEAVMPETFADWCQEAARRFPESAESEYNLVLHALSLALVESAEVSASPAELSSRFHDPLVFIKPTDEFSKIAKGMGHTLLRLAKGVQAPDLRSAHMVAWDLAQIEVRSGVEEAIKSELSKRKIRRGTKRYREFLEQHAGKILEAEKEAFESAKEQQMAELEREKRKWTQEAEKALEQKERLERDLDIVTGVYTLADEKIPAEIIDAVQKAAHELDAAADIKKAFRDAEAKIKEQTFEQCVEGRGGYLKEAWEIYRQTLPEEEQKRPGQAEEGHPDEKILQEIIDKWRTAKKRVVAWVIKDLNRLTETDTEPAREALAEYEDIARSDYDSAEEYREAKEEAWEEFLAALEGLEPGDLKEEEGG
ncbi:MAG: hypothetical protein K6U74_02405 [Firmicutes bacterium]|nr:hypothetical protein [Bacillota bacterium]